MAVLGCTNVSALMSECFVDQRHALRLETESRNQTGARKVTTFLGTPETATAALGTAQGVKVKKAEQWSAATAQEVRAKNLISKAEEWAAARRSRMESEDKSKGRNRGRGAQLRRKMVKQQKGFEKWRLQQQQHGPLGRIQGGEAERKASKRLLGELRVERRRCERKISEAGTARLEAERQVGIRDRLLEMSD